MWFWDDGVAVDLAFDARDLFQRMDHRLREKRHEAELQAVLLTEILLVFGAQAITADISTSLKRREHSCFVLHGDETLCDALARNGVTCDGLARAHCGGRPALDSDAAVLRGVGEAGRARGRQHDRPGATALFGASQLCGIDAGLGGKSSDSG